VGARGGSKRRDARRLRGLSGSRLVFLDDEDGRLGLHVRIERDVFLAVFIAQGLGHAPVALVRQLPPACVLVAGLDRRPVPSAATIAARPVVVAMAVKRVSAYLMARSFCPPVSKEDCWLPRMVMFCVSTM
jgi:hypothetical protein